MGLVVWMSFAYALWMRYTALYREGIIIVFGYNRGAEETNAVWAVFLLRPIFEVHWFGGNSGMSCALV